MACRAGMRSAAGRSKRCWPCRTYDVAAAMAPGSLRAKPVGIPTVVDRGPGVLAAVATVGLGGACGDAMRPRAPMPVIAVAASARTRVRVRSVTVATSASGGGKDEVDVATVTLRTLSL